ncbi:MAG: NAD-dependent succinate-semialdehyde dehydrogenase [Saprospiraceae bacterium]
MRTTISNSQNNRALDSSSFVSINPVDGEVIQAFEALTGVEIAAKLQASTSAYHDWKNQSLAIRQACILQFASRLVLQQEELAQLITLEMGKPIAQSLAEVKKCIWLCEYYAEAAPNLLEPEVIETAAQKSYLRYEPIGAILGIMPWNFPCWQALRFAIPALLAGNVVLLKPAPNVALTSIALATIFKEIIPKQAIFQCLLAEVEDIPAIIKHDLVQGIALTGSDVAGAKVAQIAGAAIKKCVLELGGSDPFIVLADADLALAAKLAAKSRMNNCGQSCISAKRIIVEQAVLDQFLPLFKAALLALKIGDPLDSTTQISTMARADLRDNLNAQFEDAVAKGAKVYLAGGPRTGKGYYFDPIILTEVQPSMRAYHEELFGPIAVVFGVADEAAAIRLANDTKYGLGAAVWSKDIAKAERLASQLSVGAVAINNLLRSDPRMPFGGIKQSGFGRELGMEGIREFVNIKSVAIYKLAK